MSIGSDGSYFLQFDLGGKTDFIDESELIAFTLIEQCGNVLPTFEVGFSTTDPSILSRLYEGVKFTVSFGQSRQQNATADLRCTRLNCVKSGAAKVTITAVGIYDALAYMRQGVQLITPKQSAAETMIAVAKSSKFTVDSNITQSLDRQSWIQPAWSNRKFVNELWTHMDLGTSFPAIAVASDGTFVIRDVLKDFKDIKVQSGKNYRWRFTTQIQNDEVDLELNGDPILDMNSSFMNAWVGHGRSKITYDLDTGDQSEILEVASPLLGLTNKMPAASDIVRSFGGSVPQTENMHPNYHKSHAFNLAHLAAFGNVLQTVSYNNVYKPTRVLDLAMFKDEDPSTRNTTAAEQTSGLYYIGKVGRNVTSRGFVTTLVLCRESLNALAG